ncbi:MAG: class I SAM-dependent methyltransferase [Chloroflexi bacterium]|nr:MAG: class I SAM-dependent methyltransferase [Chloroflexota bacterium]
MASGNGARASEVRWLRAFLKRFYYAPPLAFWRAIEARALGDGPLASPSLDIGAHDGAFAATWLLDRPPIDVGLDIEPVATADTRRAYRTLIAGDAQALPFEPGAFQTVVCNSVIEHVDDDTTVVVEFGRVLRPGGVLLFTTPSLYFHDLLDGVIRARRHGDEAEAQRYMQRTDTRIIHKHYRSLDDWTRRFDAAGMDTLEHRYYLPPAAAAFWDRWDSRWASRILNRPLYSWIGSRKLRRVVPPGFWYKLFMPWLIPPYERALREQEDPSVIGASLYLRAVRR